MLIQILKYTQELGAWTYLPSENGEQIPALLMFLINTGKYIICFLWMVNENVYYNNLKELTYIYTMLNFNQFENKGNFLSSLNIIVNFPILQLGKVHINKEFLLLTN